MNKEQFKTILLDTLNQHKLTPREVTIGAGGACLMFGLRTETEDIDVSVSKEIFESLRGKGFEETEYRGCPIVKLNAYVDVHLEDCKYETIVIDGIYCQSPHEVFRFKQSLNRAKDQADLVALREMITKNTI